MEIILKRQIEALVIDIARFRPFVGFARLVKIILWKASPDVYGLEGQWENSWATPDFDQLLMSIFILEHQADFHFITARADPFFLYHPKPVYDCSIPPTDML